MVVMLLVVVVMMVMSLPESCPAEDVAASCRGLFQIPKGRKSFVEILVGFWGVFHRFGKLCPNQGQLQDLARLLCRAQRPKGQPQGGYCPFGRCAPRPSA